MTDKCETCRDCGSAISLSLLKMSNLYVILCGCYESPNVKNRMCELCTFSQIQSQLSLRAHYGESQPLIRYTYSYIFVKYVALRI